MPDTRRHRGPHPEDAGLFEPGRWAVLRTAVADLSWLLTRGYAEHASLQLVGDRFQLAQRQRIAVMRSACSDQALQHRRQTQLAAERLAERRLEIDGFNVLTTIEAALARGVLLGGRDGCIRDMASMHGSYRRVDETGLALQMIGRTLVEFRCTQCCWYLDRPVSNSGRLRTRLEQLAAVHGWPWQVELDWNVDAVLAASPHVVATADSVILDGCRAWFNLAREVLSHCLPEAPVIVLADPPDVSCGVCSERPNNPLGKPAGL